MWYLNNRIIERYLKNKLLEIFKQNLFLINLSRRYISYRILKDLQMIFKNCNYIDSKKLFYSSFLPLAKLQGSKEEINFCFCQLLALSRSGRFRQILRYYRGKIPFKLSRFSLLNQIALFLFFLVLLPFPLSFDILAQLRAIVESS